MDVIVEIFKNYWQLFALIALELCNFLILLLKKRVKIVDSTFTQVLQELPFIISTVEKQVGNGNGKEKLNLVLYKAIEYISSNSDLTQDEAIKKYYDQLVVCIEAILSTPKKKEEN